MENVIQRKLEEVWRQQFSRRISDHLCVFDDEYAQWQKFTSRPGRPVNIQLRLFFVGKLRSYL